MRLNDVIRRAVSVSPQDSVVDAARRLLDEGSSSALVIDAGAIVGVLTERDLIEKMIVENRSPQTCRVHEVMTLAQGSIEEQTRERLNDLLGSPVSSLEDAEGVYELALTGTPIDISSVTGE